jgi:glyoxylase-like metal-dependent hydrolase (beta-lactamase superfamily II)
VHWVGGHTAGQEIVRIRTKRGWVVLASDALHYEEELIKGIPFAVVYSIPEMLRSHDTMRALAESDDHIVVAHDPKVAERYPAARPDLAGVAFRVDGPPSSPMR